MTDTKTPAAPVTLTPAERKKVEALLWKHTHRDFKGKYNGVKTVLHLNPKTGGTELWSLNSFTDADLLDKLPRSVREGYLKNG